MTRQNGTMSGKVTMAVDAVTPHDVNGNIYRNGSKTGNYPCNNNEDTANQEKPGKEVASDVTAQGSTPSADVSEPSLLHHIFSWRGVIYLLLHFSFIALNLPRTATNMAFVCIDSKRAEVLELANASGLITDLDVWRAEIAILTNSNGSEMASSRNESVWDVYGHVMNDINWPASTTALTLSGALFLTCLGPIFYDRIRLKAGSKRLIFVTLCVNSALMISSPLFARISPYIFLANQILLGFTASGNSPIVGSIIPLWAPEKGRLTATAIIYAGYNIGSVISSFMNGFLCSISIDNGWPFIFYVSGILIFIYAVAWFFFMSDSPETHPFISEREKVYLMTTRSKALQRKGKKAPPYLAIAKSIPVLAYYFAFSCFIWTMAVLFVYTPLYLRSVQGFNASVTGVVFAAIACVRVVGSFTWTVIGNTLTNRGFLSNAATRKTCICIGFGVAGCTSFAVSFFDRDNRWIAIALIMTTMLFQAVSTSHLSALPMDLAPQYAGTLMSMNSSIGFLFALSGPLIVGYLTPSGSYSEWRYVWYVIGCIFLSASLVFLIFGQAKLQPWAAIVVDREEPDPDVENGDLELQPAPFALQPVTSMSTSGNPPVDESLGDTETPSEFGQNKTGSTVSKPGVASVEHERDNPAFEEDLPTSNTSQITEKTQAGLSNSHKNDTFDLKTDLNGKKEQGRYPDDELKSDSSKEKNWKNEKISESTRL